VITPIALDHQKWLGDSIEKIAIEKAGIIKSERPVVSAPQPPEAARVIRARAKECEAPLQFVDRPYGKSPAGLRGDHQKLNAAVAIAALRAADIDFDSRAISRGLIKVRWPARFQFWDNRTVIDGAHNPAAAKVLAQTWREVFGDKRATLILAILSDKDFPEICQTLVSLAGSILLPKIRSERAADPNELAKIIASITPSLPCSVVPTIANAIATARGKANPILIAGSLHFAGETLAYLQHRPAAFEECAQ